MSERAIDCKLEAWERQDGEKQLGLYWTPKDSPELKILIMSWWCSKDVWYTSGLPQVIEELHKGLLAGRYKKKNDDWGAGGVIK